MDTPNQTPVETPVTTPVITPSAVPVAQPLPMQTEESGSSRTRMWMIIGGAVVVLGLVATMFGGNLFKGFFLVDGTSSPLSLPLYVKIQSLDENKEDKSHTVTINIVHIDKVNTFPSSKKFTLNVYTQDTKSNTEKLLFSKPWNTSGTMTLRPEQILTYKVRIPLTELDFGTVNQVRAELFEIDSSGKEITIPGNFSKSIFTKS